GLECKHRLVSRAPRGSEGGDDSPQSKAAEATIHRDEECAKVHREGKMKKRAIRIGVMGGSTTGNKGRRLAEAVGRRIAEKGAILVCGGLGGIMEAAAKGAKEAGGTVVGILPGDDEKEANEYIDIPIITGMGHARNVINVKTSHVIIAIQGESGTISEIALSLKCGKPVIVLDSWRLDKIGCTDTNLHVAHTPEEAVEKAFKLAECV
ncbi:MAG: TIGR00725 family protein, partial [bacterium]